MAAPAAGQKVRAADFETCAYDVETANDTSASTTYITGTSHGAAFVAPTSGAVWIDFGGVLGSDSTTSALRSYLTIQVRTGAVVGSGTTVLAASDLQSIRYYTPKTAAGYHYAEVCRRYLLTGLTAGDDYNVQTLYRAVINNAGVAARWVAVSPAFA